MNEVVDFFSGLLDTSLWPPRWHCGKWSSFHGWLYIISDLLIFSAYFAIPVIIVRFIATRTNTRFHKIYFLFAAFILACGFTHLIDAVTFWCPVYRFNALIRLITGLISWTTVYYLFKLLPVAFSLRTADELQVEIDHRMKVEDDLKLQLRLLNEAQEIAQLGHWQWNVATNVVSWSDNLFRIYGLPPANGGLSYEGFLQCVHPDDREHVDVNIRQAFAEKRFSQFHHCIITASGETRIMHSRGEVLIDDGGNVTGMIGTGQDVTGQKQIEQELLMKSAELEMKNSELQKFAYIASHDLQEPLRKIRTFISRLQDDVIAKDPERAALYMDKVAGAAIRMHTLIDDILNFSSLSVEQNAQFFAPVDLNNILKGVTSDMEIAIENHKVKLVADDLPVIQANATQMAQLFQNLISNAIKFRGQDREPEVRITCQILPGPQIQAPIHMKAHYTFTGWIESRQWAQEQFCKLTFTDNGIGFDQVYADRIFEAFQRLDTTFGGTGIGLAICKKIAENHNGFITAEGGSGHGARFIIILPVSQANFRPRAGAQL